MACTSELLPFDFPHHVWRREVTSTTYVPDETTNMWGRRVYGEHVVLHRHDVCERCGATRHEEDCICDVADIDRWQELPASSASSSEPA